MRLNCKNQTQRCLYYAICSAAALRELFSGVKLSVKLDTALTYVWEQEYVFGYFWLKELIFFFDASESGPSIDAIHHAVSSVHT